MPNTKRPTRPAAGLTSTAISDTDVEQLVTAACTATPFDLNDPQLRYAVAEFDHCYNVARYTDGQWSWASQHPPFTGAPTSPAAAPRHQLNRLRLFGEDTEIVIAANTDDTFLGRRNTPTPGDLPHALRPRRRSYLLADSPDAGLHPAHGFTRITQRTGQTTVIPFTFQPGAIPLGHTCEYFTADPDTGAVTVTAVTWTGFSDGAAPISTQK